MGCNLAPSSSPVRAMPVKLHTVPVSLSLRLNLLDHIEGQEPAGRIGTRGEIYQPSIHHPF